MSEIRTLERCGKLVEPSERPCMRVLGHLGDCVPALFNADELAAMEKSLLRHPPGTMYSPPSLIKIVKGLSRNVWLAIIFAALIVVYQVFIDSYVLVTILK